MKKIKNRIIFSEKEKNNIVKMYIEKEYSSIEIGKAYNVSWRFILNKLKEWDIDIRKKHSFTERRKNNLLNTIKEKQDNGEDWGKGRLGTGIKLNAKLLNYKHWIEEKSLRDIGLEMGCSEFPIRRSLLKNNYKIRSCHNRSNRSNIKFIKSRKGVKVSKEIANRLRDNRSKQVFPLKDTKIEIKIRNFLDELKIQYKQHRMMNEIKYRYQCDFYIPVQEGISCKTIIEADGEYWHANPEYNGNFMKYSTKIRQNRIKDFERTSQLEEKGFKVLRLWEFEIKEMTLEDFKNKLK